MPNKPIADWTLGEIKRECDKYDGSVYYCEECMLYTFCEKCKRTDISPDKWDLTDPPRFDADELAFMRMLYKGGARWLARDEQYGCLMWYECKPKKLHDEWSEYRNQNGAIPAELFQQIQWSDTEPIEIAKYIEKGGDE